MAAVATLFVSIGALRYQPSPLSPGLGWGGFIGEFGGGADDSGSGPVGGAVLQQSAPVWSVSSDGDALQQHRRRACTQRPASERDEDQDSESESVMQTDPQNHH